MQISDDIQAIDDIISSGKFTQKMANDLKYEIGRLHDGLRNVRVQVFRTNNYIIYRPLKKNDRSDGMYCFSEIENFFFKKAGDDPQICYFGCNNFDDWLDENLPVKIFRKKE